MAIERGYEVVALSFDYGQKHRKELESAKKIARHFAVKDHIVMNLELGELLRSSLTRAAEQVPTDRARAEMSKVIPSTYVPSRNIIFLSLASSIAESRAADAVFIAANAVDFSGYPDCTPEFIDSFQRVLQVGTKAGVEGRAVVIEAPVLRYSKADIIREAVRLKVPLEMTWSCYKGGRKACGKCDSCILRLEGFAAAGLKDPLQYEEIR